jgi:hypothetical protein
MTRFYTFLNSGTSLLTIRQENARTNQQNQQAARLGGLLHAQGHTLKQIAQELNEGGYRTRRGKLFFPMSVQRSLEWSAVPASTLTGE